MRREALALVLLAAATASAAAAERYGFGRAPTAAELSAWDVDIRADGRGLPPGGGSAEQGRALYAARCAACHGANGEGTPADPLVGDKDALKSAKPLKTVGSFWPYAPTLFDYVRRAMPFDAPQSLSDDEVYAVSAYLLALNGVVPANASLDAASLAAIRMPNGDGFIPDPRPDAR